jgi:hypothetical protein
MREPPYVREMQAGERLPGGDSHPTVQTNPQKHPPVADATRLREAPGAGRRRRVGLAVEPGVSECISETGEIPRVTPTFSPREIRQFSTLVPQKRRGGGAAGGVPFDRDTCELGSRHQASRCSVKSDYFPNPSPLVGVRAAEVHRGHPRSSSGLQREFHPPSSASISVPKRFLPSVPQLCRPPPPYAHSLTKDPQNRPNGQNTT